MDVFLSLADPPPPYPSLKFEPRKTNQKRADKRAEIRKIHLWNPKHPFKKWFFQLDDSIIHTCLHGKCLEMVVQAWIIFLSSNYLGTDLVILMAPVLFWRKIPPVNPICVYFFLPGGWGTFKFNSVLRPPPIFVGEIRYTCPWVSENSGIFQITIFSTEIEEFEEAKLQKYEFGHLKKTSHARWRMFAVHHFEIFWKNSLTYVISVRRSKYHHRK